MLLLVGLAVALIMPGATAETVQGFVTPPRFHVGAAAAVLDLPGVPVGEPLQVRALYVSDGGTADVVVSVPVRGWLAGYRDGARLGLTELRQQAAYQLATAFHPPVRPGLTGVVDGSGRLEDQAVTQGNIVVASVQCAACLDVSGREQPVDRLVLRAVYDQTLAVILAAGRNARAATLEWAVAEAASATASTVGLAGSDEGRAGDERLTVLRALDDDTGTTVGTIVSVPVAGVTVAGGPVSADHLGAAARELDARLGGITVPVPATLVDQVPLGRGGPDMQLLSGRHGARTAAAAAQALRNNARPVLDREVDASEVYQLVPGADLVAAGERSVLPPYLVGGAVGVWTTVLRIGEVAFVSQPGEALPHVTRALREGLVGAAVVGVVGAAQDDLGPIGGPGLEGARSAAGPTLAQQSVEAALLAAGRVGYATSAVPPVAAAAPDASRYAAAGVQVLGVPRAAGEEGAGVPVLVVWADARLGLERGAGTPRLLVDGREVVVTGTAGYGEAVLHGTGEHRLVALLPGTSASWRTCVRVLDPSTVVACAN